MHKRIVYSIIGALKLIDKDRSDDRKILHFIIDEKETGGFWGLGILVNPEYQHLISHIEGIGMGIGAIYGEGLGVNKKWNYIFFN